MNYYTTNEDVLESVKKLLGGGFSDAKQVNFGVAYSHNRKMSVVVIELSPSTIVNSLLFFYSKGMTLYDVFSYKSKSCFRVAQSGQSVKHIDRINKFLMNGIQRYNPIAQRKIEEEMNSETEIETKDNQIQHLKDRLSIEQEKNRSLQNQIKALKAKKN
ncbi:MAG: hypothetical protein ABSC53_04215 [Bacteroidota bacterium]|jgi:hypothetical protein